MLNRWQKILLFLFVLFLPSQLSIHLWPGFSVINGYRVDYLSPTLYLTDIILAVLVFLSAREIARWHPWSFLSNNPIVVVSLVFIVFNVVFSLQPLFTIYCYIRILFLSIFVVIYSRKNYFLPLVLKSLTLSLAWVSVLAACQFFFKHSVGGFWYWLGERPLSLSMLNVAKVSLGNIGIVLRPYATFPHPNALAGFALGCFLVFLISRKYLLCMLSSLMLLLSFSRSAIFVYLLFVLAYFFKKKSVYFIPLLALPFFLPGNPLSLSERLSQVFPAWQAIQKNPLFGVGLGNYLLALPKYPYQPVHNLFLLLVTELGVPLSVFFSVILKKLISASSHFYIMFLLVPVLATSLSDHYWLTSHQNLFLFFLLFAIGYNMAHAKPAKNIY